MYYKGDTLMQNKTKKATYLTKRVKKAQSNARFAGTLYFLGNIALIALACLGLFANGGNNLWVMTCYQPILDVVGGAALTSTVFSNVVACGTYALILIFGLINLIRSFTKLGWLAKKKASYTYGFNRPEYAMEDLGRIFSDTFHAIVFLGLISYMFYGATAITLYGFAAIGGGLFIHFVAGLIGGNVSLFVIDNKVIEEKRAFGCFSVFLRNLFQIAAVAGIAYALVQLNGIYDFAIVMLSSGYADIMAMIYPACQVVVLVWFLFLSKHATNITEFDRDGVEARGMKNFTVFSFLTFITMAAAIAVEVFVRGTFAINAVIAAPQLWALVIAAIGLVMFIIQLIMSKFPLEKKSIKNARIAAEQAAALAAMPAPRTGIGFGCVNKPGIINQGGHEYMVMPLGYNTEYIPDVDELDSYEFGFEEEEE